MSQSFWTKNSAARSNVDAEIVDALVDKLQDYELHLLRLNLLSKWT
jgi:hypothetical protein